MPDDVHQIIAIRQEQGRPALWTQYTAHLLHTQKRVEEMLQAAEVGHIVEVLIDKRQDFTIGNSYYL